MTSRAALVGILLASSAVAQELEVRPAAVKDVDIIERLGEPVPRGLTFIREDGSTARLDDLFGKGKPVVLALGYYRCPMLCNLVLSGLAESMRKTGLDLGEDFLALSVSVDPNETPELANERRRGHLQPFGRPISSSDWGFWVGKESAITALSEAVGFRYAYDAQTQQYAHAAAVVVLTPEGRVSRYLYGMQFAPRDLKLALLEASGGRVGTSFDRLLLTCYRYDPAQRRYALFIRGFIQGGGLLVFAALTTTLAVFWRRELKRGTAR